MYTVCIRLYCIYTVYIRYSTVYGNVIYGSGQPYTYANIAQMPMHNKGCVAIVLQICARSLMGTMTCTMFSTRRRAWLLVTPTPPSTKQVCTAWELMCACKAERWLKPYAQKILDTFNFIAANKGTNFPLGSN